jgi:hypothetical protein
MELSGAFTHLGNNQIYLGAGHSITLDNYASLETLTEADFIFHNSGVLQG